MPVNPASSYSPSATMHELFRTMLLSKPFIMFVVCLIAAPVLADDTDLRIEKALKAAGIAGQVEYLPQGILSAVPEDAFPDKKTRAGAAAFLREAAGKDAPLAVVHAAVRESLHGEVPEEVTNFLDSKVGKKVARAQQSALETSAIKRVREGRSILLSLHEARTALLKRIIKAQRVSEGNGRLLNTVIRGLVDGSLTDGAQAAPSEETTRKIALIEKEIQEERQGAEETALISYAHLLRSLDDKELEELAVYEESQPAARFRDAVQRGLEQVVYRCAKALGEYAGKSRPVPQKRQHTAPEEKRRDRDRDPQSPWGD
jgi:hypothetical protein